MGWAASDFGYGGFILSLGGGANLVAGNEQAAHNRQNQSFTCGAFSYAEPMRHSSSSVSENKS
jgi:hypothetical protein